MNQVYHVKTRTARTNDWNLHQVLNDLDNARLSVELALTDNKFDCAQINVVTTEFVERMVKKGESKDSKKDLTQE